MQLINFENDEYHVATASNLEEEKKLIEDGFEYVRYSEKDGWPSTAKGSDRSTLV